ncbi:MAG: pyridoxamine 5'-phosphate oxidase family protein [bacterium]|nr:pyridoxamine 5'-phosphate oxidase family protein [bacterium]
MEIGEHWEEIRKLFEKSMGNYAFATINEDGSPHVSPIGSLFLRADQTGFYFEEYSRILNKNLNRDNRICVLAVDFRKSFWARSFIRGRYIAPPAVRIIGTVGERRKATPEEIKMFRGIRWVRLFRWLGLKGYKAGWKPLSHVRDVKFSSFEPIHAGIMTSHNWK